MTRILLVTLLFAIISGCSRKEVVEAAFKNGNPKIVKYYLKKGNDLILEHEVVYYENKQKKIEGGYKEQQRSGLWKAWYENGNIWSEGEYKNGKRNGAGISYHENGKIHIKSLYRDDIRVGIWSFYDTTGVLINEVNLDLVPGNQEADSIK